MSINNSKKPEVKKPRPKAQTGAMKNKPYHSKTSEERAEQARINGAQTAALPRDGYKKVAKYKEPKPTEYDLYADIYDPRAKYPPEIKIQAATCYMLTGTLTGAARMCGLRKETIWDWKNNSQWWDGVLTKIKKDKQDELDATITKLIHDSVGVLAERLVSGDEVLVKDNGGEYRSMLRKVSARDVTSAIATLYDKRTMLRGDPTSITRKETSADVLNTLRAEFAGVAKRAAAEELDKKVIN